CGLCGRGADAAAGGAEPSRGGAAKEGTHRTCVLLGGAAMPLSASAAEERVESLFEDWRQNRERMALVNRWYRNTLNDEDKPSMPRSPTPEFKELRDRSITGWLKLAVTVVAQAMYVEGYRAADQSSNASPWRVWQ